MNKKPKNHFNQQRSNNNERVLEVERRKNRSKSIDAIRHTKHIVNAEKKKKINCWTRCDQKEVEEVRREGKSIIIMAKSIKTYYCAF